MAYYIPKTVSGQTCTVTDGAAGIPLESVIVNIPASSPAVMSFSFSHMAPQYIFLHMVSPGEGGYGGSLDIIKGTGSTKLKHIKVKDLSWTYYTGGTNPIFYANNVPDTIIYSSGDTPNVALDGFTVYNASTRSNLSKYMPDNNISFISSGASVAIRYTSATSKDQMIQALGELDLVYESTVTTNFTFTPIEVIMRAGENEFSSSYQNTITYYSKAESEDYYTIRDSTIKDIADAIRGKTGKTTPILVEDMDDEIASIETGVSGMYIMDFTNITIPYTITNVEYGSTGAVFNDTWDRIDLPMFHAGMSLEIDIASMNIASGAHRRFISSYQNQGFIFRNTGVWSFYNGSWYDSNISDGAYFDNCTIKIVVDSQNYWHIYKNGTLVFEPSGALALSGPAIGSSDGMCVNNMTITGIRLKEIA